MSKMPAGENIAVCVRVRPLSTTELRRNEYGVWEVDEDTRVIVQRLPPTLDTKGNKKPHVFHFDHAFDKPTESVYEAVGEGIVISAMDGYNGTVFAYGQTNSGKTYTMKGVADEPGFIPLAIQDVFSYIQETPEREFLLRVSYIEIYNEVINDLFEPESTNLKCHEDPKRGVYVGGLKEHVVVSPDQVVSLLASGEAHRHVGRTNYNSVSSRSHTVFTMVIESRDRANAARANAGASQSRGSRTTMADGKSIVRLSTLSLIDLAGSEKIADEEVRRREGGYINKSLLTLGNVISKLSEGQGGHIPYRDSKLTRVLQNSLTGNARIAVVCTISPTGSCNEESLNTLKFAQRAKKITTSAKFNEVADESALLQKYRQEIMELKERLRSLEGLGAAEVELQALKRENSKILEELQEKEMVSVAMRERIGQLTKMILTSTASPPIQAASPAPGGSARASPAEAVHPSDRAPAAALAAAHAGARAESSGGDSARTMRQQSIRNNRRHTIGADSQQHAADVAAAAANVAASASASAMGDSAILEEDETGSSIGQPRQAWVLSKQKSLDNIGMQQNGDNNSAAIATLKRRLAEKEDELAVLRTANVALTAAVEELQSSVVRAAEERADAAAWLSENADHRGMSISGLLSENRLLKGRLDASVDTAARLMQLLQSHGIQLPHGIVEHQ
eukprot:Opistho-2@86808